MTSNSGSSAYSGLANPDGSNMVKPTNTATHNKYGAFYVKVSANGGQNTWFGPYYLDVGCTSTAVSGFDQSGFTTSVSVDVGSSTSNRYTYPNPTLNPARSYCTLSSNVVV